MTHMINTLQPLPSLAWLGSCTTPYNQLAGGEHSIDSVLQFIHMLVFRLTEKSMLNVLSNFLKHAKSEGSLSVVLDSEF